MSDNITLLSEKISEDVEEGKKELLTMLDELRARVKEGDVTGVAYTAMSSSGIATGWSSYASHNDLSFGMSLLHHRYHASCLAE